MLENLENLRLYKRYLNTVQSLLDKYFEEQKEYLCCKKGCSLCCETGRYPYSQVEFDYLMSGFFSLERSVQIEIAQNIKLLKNEYEKSEDKEHFMYRCPFLNSEGLCSVYEFRGIICRTFGLIHRNINNAVTLPFCYENGLNYSTVYNPETKKIDYDKVKELNYQNVPRDYKISLGYLLNKDIFVNESFEFGELKSIIEWL